MTTSNITRTRPNINDIAMFLAQDSAAAVAHLIETHLPQLDTDSIRDAVMNAVSAEIDHKLRFKVQGDIQLADYEIQSVTEREAEKGKTPPKEKSANPFF
jgi:hypothetical protein